MFRTGVAILACGVGVALTGCGGQEAEVVQTAFEKDVKSANIEMAINVQSGPQGVRIPPAGP